ncbi:MAG TPA: hypothetical protein VIJ93_05405, partial [bacterium]
MRKSDDDLKIDISDLFGGELPSPSEELSATEEIAEPAVAEKAVPAPKENENKFQEWMDTRNAELEAKTQELELRLQEMQAQQTPPPAQTETPVVEEIQAAAEEVPIAAVTDSVIDFNAPIAPPFMGSVSSEEPPAGPETESQAVDPNKIEELRKLQSDHEFLMLYDEFRSIIAHELKDLVGEKKTYTMLGRTVELSREKFPEIFRNANWDAAGNLLEDGSVDGQRIIENKNSLDPQKSEVVLDAALSTLLNLRLQAVEKGLGTGLKNKIRARMFQWINE